MFVNYNYNTVSIMWVHHNLLSSLPQVEYLCHFSLISVNNTNMVISVGTIFYPFGFIYLEYAFLARMIGSWQGLSSCYCQITL